MMSQEWVVILASVAAIITFANTLISFVHARLKEAETPDARWRVWFRTLAAVTVLLAVANFITIVTGPFWLWVTLTLLGGFGGLGLNLMLTGPVTRLEVVGIGVTCATLAMTVNLAINFYTTHQILHMLNALKPATH
jgi:hypothetical protein